MNEFWRPLTHPQISEGYQLSTYGNIRYKDGKSYEPEYHSTNGYNYSSFIMKKEYHEKGITSRLFPIDFLIGLTFLTTHPTLRDVIVKINHIDGDNRNNHLSNLEWVEDVEEWRPLISEVIDNNGDIARVPLGEYMISNHGKVYSVKNNMMMKTYIDEGYHKINLSHTINGTRIQKRVKLHRVIAMSFNLPGYDELHNFINHIDGCRSNNNINNLEWVSNQDNVRHAFMMGLEVNPKGQDHPRSKFTDNQRKCIYEILKTLKWTPPSILTKLIAEKLPNISNDDIKYAKQVIKKTEGFEFPILPNPFGGKVLQLSEEEIETIRKITTNIFEKYGITQMEVYENEYKKKRQG